MKKTFISLIAVVLFAAVGKAETLYSSVKSSFLTAVSTTSATGRFAANSIVQTKVKKIVVTWDVSTTTAAFKLYDNLLGSNSTLVYEVRIPSAATQLNSIETTFDYAAPMIADYGLIGTCDGGKDVSCTIFYW